MSEVHNWSGEAPAIPVDISNTQFGCYDGPYLLPSSVRPMAGKDALTAAALLHVNIGHFNDQQEHGHLQLVKVYYCIY